jgi:uncharacterized protein YndB with AHSA1/START domain
MTPDHIERDIVIDAPIDRVWAVLTEAEHMRQWLADDGAEVDARPGGAITLGWKKFGTFNARVEKMQPPKFFSYRWARDADTDPGPGKATLVEFTLTEQDGATRLTVRESGFAALDRPDSDNLKYAEGNNEGWLEKLAELRDYIQQLP